MGRERATLWTADGSERPGAVPADQSVVVALDFTGGGTFCHR